MGLLAFFPWYTVAAPTAIGRFRLVPHRVGASLQAEPRLIDATLAPFTDPGGRPIESATLVQLEGRALTDEVGEEDEAALFHLGEAVAFSALARRGFFDAAGYVNADQLAFVVRRFHGTDPRDLHVAYRRRDGRRWIAYGPGVFRTARAPHVPPLPRHDLDRSIAAGLLAAREAGRGGPYQAAVAAFNAANGEGDHTSVGQDLLSLVGAFERLLEASTEDALAARLLALLGPFVAAARTPPRLGTLRRLEAAVGAPRPSTSITAAWLGDLLRARRALGGGAAPAAYWPPEAHLLLGAHLFPAAVLARLAADGFRPLTDADRGMLLAFPYLAALRDPFARRRSLGARKPHLWRCALEVAGRRLARLQVAEVLARAQLGDAA